MKCTECNGTGEIEVHSQMLMCPECFGKGEIKDNEPMTPLSVTGDVTALSALDTAISDKIEDMMMFEDLFPRHLTYLRQWKSVVVQAIKDLQFDQETNPLPFPEK